MRRALAIVSLGVLLLAGCTSQPSELTADDIVGTWAAEDGGAIRFASDGTFTADDLLVDPISSLETGFSGAGTWEPGAKPATIDVVWTVGESLGANLLPGGEATQDVLPLSADGTRILLLDLRTDGNYELTHR